MGLTDAFSFLNYAIATIDNVQRQGLSTNNALPATSLDRPWVNQMCLRSKKWHSKVNYKSKEWKRDKCFHDPECSASQYDRYWPVEHFKFCED